MKILRLALSLKNISIFRNAGNNRRDAGTSCSDAEAIRRDAGDALRLLAVPI